jgi:general secretion pathway protein A
MYKTFYKLRLNPFGNSPDPRFLYMMPHTREALAALEFGIGARRGFIVITGEQALAKPHYYVRHLNHSIPQRS